MNDWDWMEKFDHPSAMVHLSNQESLFIESLASYSVASFSFGMLWPMAPPPLHRNAFDVQTTTLIITSKAKSATLGSAGPDALKRS